MTKIEKFKCIKVVKTTLQIWFLNHNGNLYMRQIGSKVFKVVDEDWDFYKIKEYYDSKKYKFIWIEGPSLGEVEVI